MQHPKKRCELVIFNGIIFRRYPDSPHVVHRNYYSPSGNYRKKGVEQLHREIWKAAYGPIPDGCDIHHRDHNPLNNDIENLECVTRERHNALHEAEMTPAQLACRRYRFGDHVRPKSANWHRSEEGREWHRELSRQVWAERQLVTRSCEQCNKEFDTKHLGPSRFCSKVCKAKWRRDAGLDNVEKVCEKCGAVFTSNKYDKARFCSHLCARRSRHWKN